MYIVAVSSTQDLRPCLHILSEMSPKHTLECIKVVNVLLHETRYSDRRQVRVFAQMYGPSTAMVF